MKDFCKEIVLSILHFFGNDKNLVIITTFIIALAAMCIFGRDSREIVQCVVTGLFGIAVGATSGVSMLTKNKNKNNSSEADSQKTNESEV